MALHCKTWTTHVDADGRKVPADTPGATKRKRRSADWYGRYRDADGIVRVIKLCRNKTAAQAMLNEFVRQAELGKAGIVDPFAEHAARPLRDYVAEYRRYLSGKGNTASHVDGTIGRITAIVEGCGFKRIGDISASRLVAWLADRRAADAFGVSTSNHYLTACK